MSNADRIATRCWSGIETEDVRAGATCQRIVAITSGQQVVAGAAV